MSQFDNYEKFRAALKARIEFGSGGRAVGTRIHQFRGHYTN
jgi:hypothetical protein